MNTYTFIIGSADDFESLDELISHFESSSFPNSICNCSSYEFDAPAGCDQDTIVMIGRGYAFSNDWCMDHTFSTCIRGTLEV
jgi:hypothetical protein